MRRFTASNWTVILSAIFDPGEPERFQHPSRDWFFRVAFFQVQIEPEFFYEGNFESLDKFYECSVRIFGVGEPAVCLTQFEGVATINGEGESRFLTRLF